MKIDKFILGLKIFIVILTIVLAITILISIITYKPEPLNSIKCTQKGNICTEQEIFKGIKVEIEVSKNNKKQFYVISNDANTMTLLMTKNVLKEVNWHAELTNIKGPAEALLTSVNKTNSWSNIELIKDYVYEDAGLKSYLKICPNNNVDPHYDCSIEAHTTRGYKDLTIKDGKLTLHYNTPSNSEIKWQTEYTFDSPSINSRLITVEEIENLNKNQKLPTWLIDNLDANEGYWTLTSSIAMKTGYSQGAIALANVDGQPSIESIYTMSLYEPNFEIGVRPVIIVNKK